MHEIQLMKMFGISLNSSIGICSSKALFFYCVTSLLLRVKDFCYIPGGTSGKESACQCRRHETWVRVLGLEDPLEKERATHSSILAWRISWTEECGRLQFMESQRLRYD